jgi:hypothetical protein
MFRCLFAVNHYAPEPVDLYGPQLLEKQHVRSQLYSCP